MLKLIYDALWYPAMPVTALALAGLDQHKLKQRLGVVQVPPDAGRPRIWLHAASVGEVEGARPIAAGLARQSAAPALFITCMTETGCRAARTGIPSASAVTLAPLDCRTCVRRFLNAVRPRVLLLAETELWPNYLLEARRANIEAAIINARLSVRSLARYRALRALFGVALESLALVLAQSGEDAERYAALGVPSDRIIVVGNPKFDAEWLRATPPPRPALANFTRDRNVFVAGSTGAGEEPIVIEAYLSLRLEFPDLTLILAPRHPARTAEVEALIRGAGLCYVKASTLADCASGSGEHPHVLLLDTLGELRGLYFGTALAFVGGSLRPGRGGQSLAEPAAAGVPVIFGPYHETQGLIARALLQAGGGWIARDAGEIATFAAPLLRDANLRHAAGQSAHAALGQLGGGAERSLMALSRLGNLG